MPFRLTNAPATFQANMNEIFSEFLRKFIIVFFDDILVFSQNLEDHVKHLKAVMEVMRKNNLTAKREKCSFQEASLLFLGHIIAGDGIRPDQEKINAMVRGQHRNQLNH